jgi:hypothetical protein
MIEEALAHCGAVAGNISVNDTGNREEQVTPVP